MREQIVKIRTVANQFDALLFHPLPTASFSLHTVTQGYTYYGPRLIRTEVRKPRSISRGCAHVRNALRKCPLILTHLQLAGYLQNNARHRTYSSMLYCTGNWLKSGPKHATTVPYILSVYSIRPPYLRLRHLTPPLVAKATHNCQRAPNGIPSPGTIHYTSSDHIHLVFFSGVLPTNTTQPFHRAAFELFFSSFLN